MISLEITRSSYAKKGNFHSLYSVAEKRLSEPLGSSLRATERAWSMTRRAQGRGRSRPLWAGGGIPHALRAAWSFALPTGEMRRVLWHRNGASGWPFGDAGTEGQPGFT